MTTIQSAVTARILERYVTPVQEQRVCIRQLWIAREFVKMVDQCEVLYDLKKGVGHRTLFEHMEQLFCDFRCSHPFPAGVLRRLMPTSKGVWKMHPPKLRIYGWCPGEDSFVVVTGALETETKLKPELNNAMRNDVLAFIRRHGLSQTVKYGDINAIFS